MDIQDFRKLVENNNDGFNNELKEYLNSVDIYTIIFPHGENLLHFAAGSGNVEMCKYLIYEKNVHPNIYNARGATPLLYACLKNQEEVVKILLSENVDTRIRSGYSGLFPYQSTSNENIRKLLEKHDKIIPIDFDNGKSKLDIS
jgi:ankyrin repeat protein